MSVIDRITETITETWYRATGQAELAEQLRGERQQAAFLQETLADLENRMHEPGWQRLTAYAEQEFSRPGLQQITAVCRIMAIKNPLIKRGLALRQAYVWGQGVATTARDETVNEVIQAFLADPSNKRTFSGAQACEQLERSLGTDGNVFFALFTAPRTGRVQVRTLPWDEVTDVISNPEDRSEPWFYRREWWSETQDLATGAIIQKRELAYYPALGHRPKARPSLVWDVHGAGPVKVMWDAPVMHIAVNGLTDWKFGVPDAYAAVDWANAYREFLTDWAQLVRALSRFAWRLTSKGTKQAAAKAKLGAAPSIDPHSGDRRFAGATVSMPPDMSLDPIPKTGATIDSESGRPLAAMVAAALDVPVTMLLGDPGTTGNRATAETLDTPTEQAAELRRAAWTDARQAIYAHVILESVRAPEGALKGKITVDEFGREVVELAGGIDGTVDINWPDLDDTPVNTIVQAIVQADSTTRIPPLVTARLLLQALGVQDVDEILDQLTDDQGNYLPPDGGGGGAGQAAVDAFRRGEDPAAILAGQPNGGGDGGDQSGDPPPGGGDARGGRRAR
ncbi:MAG: hypothetical protein ACRDP6_14755 [Actinoallomurus sp.]